MHISLAAEKLFSVFGLPITNAIITTWIVGLALITLGFILRRNLKPIPGKLQCFVEFVYGYFVDTAGSVIGRKDVARDLLPYVMTLFLFIVCSNWSELLPGNNTFGILHTVASESGHGTETELVSFLRPPSTDLNMVSFLALMSVGYVQYLGMKYVGVKKYLHTFFNFSNPINFFIGILEFFSELTRTVSYTFRLFGNIFAGEVLVGVIYYVMMTLVPFIPILPLPFYFLELFIGLIQGFVFCFLTIVLTSVAVNSHH